MTRIYIIRHCESEGNACRRSQAMYDGIITTKGMAQNKYLCQRFENIMLDAIYSSDSYRAKKTAESLAHLYGLKIKYRLLLREYTTAGWEGTATGNIPRISPEGYSVWREAPWQAFNEGADRLSQIAARMTEVFHRIVEENRGGTVAIVTHVFSQRALLCSLLKLEKEKFLDIPYGDNTSVTYLEVSDNGDINIEYIGDCSHLPHKLQKGWSGHAGADINMAVDTCKLPEDKRRLIDLSRRYCEENNIPFNSAACIEEAADLLTRDCGAISFFLYREKAVGILVLSDANPHGNEHMLIEKLYLDPFLRESEMDLQLLGQAIHLARMRDKRYIAIKKPTAEPDQKMCARFAFEEVPGKSDWIRLDLYINGRPQAI